MAPMDVTVTVSMDEHDWRLLVDAADRVGMSVDDYIGANVRVLAQRSGMATGPGRPRPTWPQVTRSAEEESEEEAWAQSFTERLSHRADLYRDC